MTTATEYNPFCQDCRMLGALCPDCREAVAPTRPCDRCGTPGATRYGEQAVAWDWDCDAPIAEPLWLCRDCAAANEREAGR